MLNGELERCGLGVEVVVGGLRVACKVVARSGARGGSILELHPVTYPPSELFAELRDRVLAAQDAGADGVGTGQLNLYECVECGGRLRAERTVKCRNCGRHVWRFLRPAPDVADGA